MIQHVFDQLRRAIWLPALLTVVLASCAPSAQEPTAVPTLTTPPTALPTASSPEDQPGQVIGQAIAALSGSLGVDASDIAMVAMERQDFPDAALGCPQPSEVAAAVLTPGYKIVLRVGDALHELHTNLNGTLVRCLPTGEPVVDIPDFSTTTPDAGQSTPPPVSTPDDGVDRTAVDMVAAAIKTENYDDLQATLPDQFWMGFYASEADSITRDEVIEKLRETYLGPGLVRVHPEVDVEKLLPDWTSAAPYARFVYSTGWGEGQKDDAILLFEERAETLHWAGLFYIFDGLKNTAYGDQAAGLPSPPTQSLGAIVDAIEGKSYETLKSLTTTPVFLGFHNAEASQLSPEAFVEALQRDYLEPAQVKVYLGVDVPRLLPDWTVDPPCDDLLYSTGWGEEQADDGILCLREVSGALRWGGMLYIFAHLKETAYAEPPALDEKPAEFEGMVHISAGPFIMGSGAGDVGSVQSDCLKNDVGCNAGQFEDETPLRQVTLKAYYIDQTEVTLAQFKAFVEASGYQTTSEAKGDAVQYTWRAFDTADRQDHPVRWMSWHDANAYCQWAGKRLPTEAEWEKAARGTEGLIYPWGNVWDEARVPQGDTAPASAFADGASPYGVLGMAGGVWEWVHDWYDPFYYQYGPADDPAGPAETRDRVLRGGAFGNAIWKHRTTHRHFGGAAGYAHDHGFRCVRDEE